MSKWTESFDRLLDDIQSVLLSILVKLGPFAVALMPALFTAYAIHKTFEAEAGTVLALVFAGVVGLAMETVGIVATHTALDLYNAWQSRKADGVKLGLMVLLVPFYVCGVSATVWYAEDAFTPLVQALGVASPWLTVVVYIAVALARDLRRIEQMSQHESQHKISIELDERQHQRRIELRKLELDAARLQKQAELSARVQIEQARIAAQPALAVAPEPDVDEHLCECGRTFATRQALNAHKRFCNAENEPPAGHSTNGHNGVRSNGVG